MIQRRPEERARYSKPLKPAVRMGRRSAFYIKLGRGGEWEDDSIGTGKLRFGWSQQTPDDINAARWDLIEGQLRAAHEGKPKGEATRALNGLRTIAESGPEDVWITFHQAKLWWTRVASAPVEQDGISMFRRAAQPWTDRAADGRLLVINDLPGRLAQIQGYRWTVCRVHCLDQLARTLSGTRSDLATAISSDQAVLAKHLSEAIKELYWKDFETLTVANFSAKDFRRVYFFVHSPANDLADAAELPDHVEVVLPDRLARLAMDAGLAGWLEDKVS